MTVVHIDTCTNVSSSEQFYSSLSLDFVFLFNLYCVFVYFGVSMGLLCSFICFLFNCVFSILARRLAGKSISEMAYFVLSGMRNLNPINQPVKTETWQEAIFCYYLYWSQLIPGTAVLRMVSWTTYWPKYWNVSHLESQSAKYTLVWTSLDVIRFSKCFYHKIVGHHWWYCRTLNMLLHYLMKYLALLDPRLPVA